jgi:multidrug efflux pump subunit AcrB
LAARSRSDDPGGPPPSAGLAARVVRLFIDSKVTPLLLLFAVIVGGLAVLQLPREEEPQIQVPLIDVLVAMPGAPPREVEQRVTRPLEELLWELPGAEYVYSTSSYGQSLVVVRFEVGHDEERAFVLVQRKLAAHAERVSAGTGPPLVQARSIDDVPILALTLWSATRDAFELRRLTEELAHTIKAVPAVSETSIHGGQRREVQVELDPAALAAHGATAGDVLQRLRAANVRARSGSLASADAEVLVETGRQLRSLDDVRRVVVADAGGRVVHLSDVALVRDGPGEADDHVFLLPGPSQVADHAGAHCAVTLAVSKRKGANAVRVADGVLALVEREHGRTLPADVSVQVVRNYGETAAEKSNELLLHMGIAVVSVMLLIAFALGWREAGIVAIAIPVTLALTLAVFYLLGYTLNRITLFALIFSIGILVDDPIVDVENIVRHFRMPANRGRNLLEVTVEAVDEVRSPLILATLAVVCAVLPMAFVRGLMGPYMRPIPVGASSAMLVSMGVAFVITPWAAYRVLRGPAARGTLGGHAEGGREDLLTRLYRRLMGPLIRSPRWRLAFFATLTGLLLAAAALVPLRAVVVKMLPFDDKSELQVIVDMPEGTSLEATTNVALELARAVRDEPEVASVGVYAGTASPYNFNGLVRHYYLRRGPHVADLLIQLVGKHERAAQSHDFARRIRPRVEAVAERLGARIKLAEVPPGPPVLQTLVAEVYAEGPLRDEIARNVLALFEEREGVVDVDWFREDDQLREQVVVDDVKAAAHGVAVGAAEEALRVALSGAAAGLLHDELARADTPIRLRLPRRLRADLRAALDVRVRARGGGLVPVGELVRVERGIAEKSILHKNLLPVQYVTGDVAGRVESSAYAILDMRGELDALAPEPLEEYWASVPYAARGPALKWDGEMHITLEVFRDLGLAFGVVLVLIYVLIVGWFRSFVTPLIIMAAIPFSLVGILPAHWALGAFFTATSIIGFIAGAGIVVRNSIILVDFIELRLAQGAPLAQAVVDAGAVRFRPMLLTAAAVMAGAGVILFDPIFQGLAISLIAGEIASMSLSRIAVPVLYYRVYRGRRGAAARAAPLSARRRPGRAR